LSALAQLTFQGELCRYRVGHFLVVKQVSLPAALAFLSAASAFLTKSPQSAAVPPGTATPTLVAMRKHGVIQAERMAQNTLPSILLEQPRHVAPLLNLRHTAAKWSAPTRANRLASPALPSATPPPASECVASRPAEAVVDILEALQTIRYNQAGDAAHSAAPCTAPPARENKSVRESVSAS